MEDLSLHTYQQLIMKFMKANDAFLKESGKFHYPSQVSAEFEEKKNYLRLIMSELDKRRMESQSDGSFGH